MTGDSKAADEWREAYQRVAELSRQAGDSGMVATVPSTPDWSARDLLAHMVGVGSDALTGDVPDDLNPEWTQGHIEQRSDSSVEELLTEWEGKAEAIEDVVRTQDTGPLGDVIIHEQDLRGALGQPGARDTLGLDLVRHDMLEMLDDAVEESLAPLSLRSTDSDWSWTSTGSGAPGAVVEAPLYDLTRAVISRRTEGQLRQWTTTGDVTAYLPAFAHLGDLPPEALPE